MKLKLTPAQVVWRGCVVSVLGDTQNPPGYGPGQPGLADPAGDKDGPEVPVSSSHSVVRCLSPALRETETGMHPHPQHLPVAPLCSVFCPWGPRIQLFFFMWDGGEVYIKVSSILWGLPAAGLKCDQTGCEGAVFWVRAPYTARLCHSQPWSKFWANT